MGKVVDVYFSLGTNLGDRIINLQEAIKAIRNEIGPIASCSSVYESEAVGFESSDKFYNICIKVTTDQDPNEILNRINAIETELGRERNPNIRYSSRKIDIDIIFYGKLILNTELLTIPHPHYTNRLFVLHPLNDLAKNFIDPKTENTIWQTLQNSQLSDQIYRVDALIFY